MVNQETISITILTSVENCFFFPNERNLSTSLKVSECSSKLFYGKICYVSPQTTQCKVFTFLFTETWFCMSAGVSLLRCVYLPFWGVYLCRLGPVGRCGLWLPAVIGFSLHPIGLSETAAPRWNPQTAPRFENGSALKKSNEGEYIHINT